MTNFTSDCWVNSLVTLSLENGLLFRNALWILPSKLATSYFTDEAKHHKAVHMGPDQMFFYTNYCSFQK